VGGLPTRTSRTALGEIFEDTYPVNNPRKEISAAIFNMAFWDVAGLCQTGLKVAIKATVSSGGVVTTGFFGLAFDPDGKVTPITFTRVAAGYYTFAFASQYPDEGGVNRSLALSHGVAMPVDPVTYRGAHTGSDGASVLTDSSQSWDTNELVGAVVYNVTDGSHGVITANTATTVTATLAGGAEDDWDNGDDYLILNAAQRGLVNLTSSYQGEMMIFDADGALVDPAAFTLALW
jgi:hypothetical protein